MIAIEGTCVNPELIIEALKVPDDWLNKLQCVKIGLVKFYKIYDVVPRDDIRFLGKPGYVLQLQSAWFVDRIPKHMYRFISNTRVADRTYYALKDTK